MCNCLQALYLYNQPDKDRTTSETPFFCFSHLIMKIVVGDTNVTAHVPSLKDETRLARSVAIPSATLTVRFLSPERRLERPLMCCCRESIIFGHDMAGP